MKTKLSLTLLLSFIFGLLSSQVPQGFNYQAVARDGAGNPLVSTALPTRITIQADSLGSSVIWQELHSSVQSNAFGLITLVLGKGARQTPSTVATFSDIDWSITPKFIKTEIYYGGSYKTLGVSRLWSVPYAAVAGDLAGSVKKLSVEGETSGLEEALFEVKNKDGQTIFAVYNEGVRIYVSDGAKAKKGGFAVGGFGTDKAESTKYMFVGKDSVRIYLDTNPLTKGKKSGFAVGGYDLTKGTVQNYLDVSADSVRIYIDSNPDAKKLKGGFAVGGYDMTKGNAQDYLDISPDSVRIYIDDTGSTKGKKGGFAVGGFDLTKGGNKNFLNVEIDTSGKINPSNNRILWYPLKNAFLTGKVLIENRDSVGENSFASGFESKSKGQYSQALGFKAIARGDYSTAIGKNAVAGSINSFAFGEDAEAILDESYALGKGAIASGYRSFAFGSAGVDDLGNPTDVATASGDYSFAIGQGSKARARGAFAMGIADTASGIYSIAIGYLTRATGKMATTMGVQTKGSGDFSTAMGWRSNAIGNYSTAIGSQTVASGGSATAMGEYSIASNSATTAMGYSTKASGLFSTAIGYKSMALGMIAVALGNQTVANGSSSTAMGSYTKAIGSYSTTIGRYTKARPYASLAVGQYNDSTCSSSGLTTWVLTDPLFIVGNGTADNARTNAFTILKNGNVGIGIASPSHLIHLSGGAYCDGTGAWIAGSDISFKKEIYDMDKYGVKEIMQLRPITFIHNQDPSNTVQLGFIAQEVVQIIPELVSGTEGSYGLAYDRISVVLVNAVKEQQRKIESQQQQIESQNQKIEQLIDLVDELKKEIASSLRSSQ